MNINQLPVATTIADSFDLLLVDKQTNEGKRMDADTFAELVIAALKNNMGELTNLTTTNKDNLVAAINEVAATGGGGGGGSTIVVDTALSSTSTNPVQNKVINTALNNKAGKAVATTSANGLMSSADKQHLDAVYADYSSAIQALGV